MKNIKHTILDILELFFIVIGILFGLAFATTQILEINGTSMEPTLFTNERILAEKISYALNSPKRYDIVIAKEPTSTNKLVVKRVIGLPNDILYLKDGNIYINDKKLTESYLRANTITSGNTFIGNDDKISIPSDSYFLLGDNREKSEDSRKFGFVPKENILGKVLLVYYPRNNIRLLSNILLR